MGHATATSTLASPERQRRLRAAPLGLLLLGWGLGVGPLAHAVFAHGEPLLRDSADRGWVRHVSREHPEAPSRREAAPTHRHAPGVLEHLQLAVAATVVCLAVAVVLFRGWTAERKAWRAPVLRRWRHPAVPGAP